MGTSRHQPERSARRRDESDESANELLRGYSRSGVVGRVRDEDGRMVWPEFQRPPLSGAGDDEHGKTREGASTELVNIKQEHSDISAERGETPTLRIGNFRRPFTLSAVQAFVQQCGDMEKGGFWMDAIKTHCYVTFASSDVARALKKAIDGTVWPAETGLKLSVTYSNVTAMEVNTNGPPKEQTLKRKASEELVPRTRVIRGRGAPASIDSKFFKTETKPMLYYLPVPETDVAFRQRDRELGRSHGGSSVKSDL